jgi:hypothetical protein
MAKAQQKESKKVKVIRVVEEAGAAYGYQIHEVEESALQLVEKSNPEVFYIFITQIENKVRELLGL